MMSLSLASFIHLRQIPHNNLPSFPLATIAKIMEAQWEASLQLGIEGLPDEIWLAVGQTLRPHDLLSLCATCNRANQLDTNSLWRALCALCWEEWPMYRLTSAREAWLDANDSTRELTWKKRYQLFQADAKRTVIMPEELQQLPWHFNFTPQAGGRGRHSLKQVRFSSRKIYVPGYPPLDFFLFDPVPANHAALPDVSAGSTANAGDPSSPQRLGRIHQLLSSLMSLPGSSDSTSDGTQHTAREQCLQIANFPPHYVKRIVRTRDWLIYNDNVQIVSCGPDGVLGEYDERGFLTDLSPIARAETG